MKEYKGIINLSEVKRLYIDLKIEKECPRCGHAMERDFNENYIFYPQEIIDGESDGTIGFYCEKCEEESRMGGNIKYEYIYPLVLEASIKLKIDMDNPK